MKEESKARNQGGVGGGRMRRKKWDGRGVHLGREEKTNISPLKLHHVCFTCEGRQSHQSRKWSERERTEGV